jgi:hypothetical protein
VVVLWLDAATPALVVKSLFQTAAFAGFPAGSFAVRRAGTRRLARLVAEARVPGPPGTEARPSVDPFVLHLDADAGKTQLVWKVASKVVQVIEVPRSALHTTIDEQWKRHGGHRDGADQVFDQAVLHVDHQTRFDAIVGLLDALYEPKREVVVGGVRQSVPAFNVTFAVN